MLLKYPKERVTLIHRNAQVYRNTAGMLPFIALITWGGMILMAGGLLGVGAPLGNLAVIGIREVATQAAARGLTREAIKKFRGQLIAILSDGLLALMPKPDTLPFEYARPAARLRRRHDLALSQRS